MKKLNPLKKSLEEPRDEGKLYGSTNITQKPSARGGSKDFFRGFNLFYIAVFVISILGCARDPKKPGYELMAEMAHPVPYETYASNPVTPDGKTLQAPPDGTVPRGFLPYHYGTTLQEAERAGRELTNPFPTSTEVLARGKKVYETFCLVCHGPEGKGDGPLIPKFPNPPSFTSKAIREYPEGRIYHVITRGFGLMASYASQIRPEDRWKVVRYVQTLQQPEGTNP